MKPAKLKRRVFRGWMDVKNQLPEKTGELTRMTWTNCRWFEPDRESKYRVKITVEWREGK